MGHSQRGVAVLLAAVACAQTPTYSRLDAAPHSGAYVAWDSVRGRVVAFEYQTQVLWDWDGQIWSPRLGAAAPGVALGVCYDPTNREVLLLSTPIAAWNGARWTTHAGSGGPNLSEGTPSAFDDQRHCIVSYVNGLIWEWHGTWTQPPQPTRPPMRIDAALAYDPSRQGCVLYGGSVAPTTALADCWTWDGSSWVQLAAAAPPGPRSSASLAFDHGAGRLVLYGGQTGQQTTWTLSGSTWTQLITATDPGERTSARLVWDGTGMLLFGGAAHVDDQDWRLQNGNWQLLPGAQPTPRYGHQWAYDEARQQAVLFSGNRLNVDLRFDDTWTFDNSWHLMTPPVAPPPRTSGGFAWSDVDNGLLLFGGSTSSALLGDTWVWNGATWQQRLPAASPPPRKMMVLVAEPVGGVMLFGGSITNGVVVGDQWHWDGSNWLQQTPVVAPSARKQAAVALDAARNRVVLAGGTFLGPLIDAWEWDGINWTSIPSVLPPSSTVNLLAYEPESGRVMLEASFGRFFWDGVSWSSVANTPTPYINTLTTDTRSGRVLSFPFDLAYADSGVLATLTNTPATVSRYGSGCALGPAPGLTTRRSPRPGESSLAIVAAALTPQAPTLLALGFAQQNVPLGSGCSQLVGNTTAVLFAASDAAGEAAFAILVPADLALRGLPFLAQMAALDPARSLVLGLTLSEGLRIQIGD